MGKPFVAVLLLLSGVACGGEAKPSVAPATTPDPTVATAPATAVDAGAADHDDGRGEGIGLGNIGTLGDGGTGPGFGNGSGRLGGGGGRAPSLRMGSPTVNGKLPIEVVERIVRQNFGRMRLCYENALRDAPTLSGQVTTKFVIDKAGAVTSAKDNGSDIGNANLVACVVKVYSALSFPQPEGGTVTVVFPVVFTPPAAEPKN